MTERARALAARVRELLAPEGSALDLAMLRVTVAFVLSTSTSVAAAEQWAALPEAARTLPEGVGWLVPHLPIDPPTVRAVRVLFHVAALLAGLGLATRASWLVTTLTAAYLLLVPQLGGAVFHDHHLLWLAVLVTASPSGDALSLDAWRARRAGRPRPERGRAHGLAIRLAWLVIGLVFFFPGVHKLAESGLAWALSDNLRNQMWWKWAQDPSLLPALRIDRHPWLCRGLAALVIVFELTFLPLVLHERTRWVAVLGALAFHTGAEVFMGIQFGVLWGTYGMFVPWSRVLAWVRARRRVAPLPEPEPMPNPGPGPSSLRPLLAAAIPLFAGIVLYGARGQMQAYPFACYPTFAWVAADHMPAMQIELERADGSRVLLDRALFQEPGPRGWALSWRLSGVYGAFDRDALEAWWADVARREPVRAALRDAVVVHVSRVELPVDPDHPGSLSVSRPLDSIRVLRTE